jgi:hypothetical protein
MNQGGKVSQGLSKARKIAAWTVIPAFFSLIYAHNILITKYPAPIDYYANSSEPQMVLWWRNASLLLVLFVSLLSIPRWQSFVGLLATGIFLYFALKF